MSVSLSIDGGDELNEYLLENREKNSKGSVGTYLSNWNLKQYLPKTGNIENDIAVRFGMSGGDSSSAVCFGLSRKDRIIGFFLFLLTGILLLMVSSFYIPILILKARKFSIIFTMGSIFSFTSMTFLWGVIPFLKHLTSPTRLIFTLMYVGSLAGTLFFAMYLQSTILTIVAVSFQFVSLLSFIVSYLPGGITGMKYLTKFVSSSLPI